ncbi:TetR/AcrR family transcriptional regulator [Sandaracinus amylolyticus]|uniref:Transcriptional regulator, TetR family protein n=1 Tax=Sandaracinus amylolyticus TaxID=927083 RepID=A0A0F6W369_9BACT|nr:TetR/AcrR family transcriptional regulator [Sandaracinus amylolyticus]AKF06325.1 Transcriptional regulator, TetR family protein [Sandaracinus amylolyticus]
MSAPARRDGAHDEPPHDGRSTRAAAMRESRRRAVLDASLRVFSEKGYHATRISDLIEAAGIARGTFYLYFESKNAIFHELLDQLLERIRASVDGVDTRVDAAPLREQLLVIVRRVLATFHQHPELTRLVLRSAPGLDDEVDRKLAAFYGQLHAWLAVSLQNAQALGLMRVLDVDFVSWSVIGAVKQIVELSLERREGADLDRATRALLDLHLDGMLLAR